MKTVVITGATGNLGAKLRHHLEGRYELRLLDRDPRGDSTVMATDLAVWDSAWVNRFRGAEAVIHLAADPLAHQTWPNLIGPNLDALIHTFEAAARNGVKRLVYASSNHVLGGYLDEPSVEHLTPDTPPRPGAKYIVAGEKRDSSPYGACKLFGERLGRFYAEVHGLEVIALRIGWVRPGDNKPEELPVERGPWFRLMWLSNRDLCHLMDRCLEANVKGFLLVNGMSANTGMRWEISETRRLLGYEPQDDVTRS